MQERVRSIGARLEVESSPGEGTLIRVKIDL
jgi:signal transduction histidine kinase